MSIGNWAVHKVMYGIQAHKSFGAKFPFSCMEILFSCKEISCHDLFMHEAFPTGTPHAHHLHNSFLGVCPSRFTGSPIWNAWRPWGECLPTCGKARSRKRVRTCNTQGVAGKTCLGETEKHQSCVRDVCKVNGKVSFFFKFQILFHIGTFVIMVFILLIH